MVKIGFGEAKKWLEKVNSNDHIALITDHDADGFTSGILFFNYCLKKGAKVKQFTYSRSSSKLEDFSLEEFNKIISTDLAASIIKEVLEKYRKKEIFYMDHHPEDAHLPKSVFEYRTVDQGYIPSASSAFELVGGIKWIALLGTVIDAGFLYPENDKFIKEGLEELNLTLEEFQERIAYPISNMILFFDSNPSKAFQLMLDLKDPFDIEEVIKYSKPLTDEAEKILNRFDSDKEDIAGAIYFYFESKYPVKPIITGMSFKKENEDTIFLFATKKNNEKISISARCQSKKVNMSDLLRAGIKDLEDARAGGHDAASGATIKSKDLPKFKENVRNYLEKIKDFS